METQKREKNLHERLLLIMEEMGSIEKLGFNDFNKYAYVKESDISKKLQPLLAKHGVFISSSITDIDSSTVKNKKGEDQNFVRVSVTYTIINASNPEDRFNVVSYGDGIDSGDKALYKASTGAHKYFLIRNFNLGSDEDTEKESPEATIQRPTPKANKTAVTPKPNFF